jgi:O-Antigen ligase
MESGVTPTDARRRPGPSVAALAQAIPAAVTIALMVLWAWHDGGYDDDTWYWGALVLLALLAAVLAGPAAWRRAPGRLARVALGAFAAYVGWSYLSIAWAAAPGTALEGSNRALLYLLVLALMTSLPWTPRGARAAVVAFTAAIGVLALAMLVRIAARSQLNVIFVDGRLFSPTGYFNSTAALFTIGALMAAMLATRPSLASAGGGAAAGPRAGLAAGLLRGALVAMACGELQLALLGQSRGWLFTLPLVLIASFALAPDRLRLAAALVLPAVAVLVPRHSLLEVYDAAPGAPLHAAAGHAAQVSLAVCAVAFAVATLVAWADSLRRGPELSAAARHRVGAVVAAVVLAAASGGALAATHGHPIRFVVDEWHGFAHQETSYNSGSHFLTPGSGRYDFWRVALDAFLAHPLGGLGQDNFADYYILHRRTLEEPAWTHSLELRLLVHTGIVGFALFGAFLVAALRAALRERRRGTILERTVLAAALVPAVDWLIHGSVDWFWEMPALSGPALAFLGVALSLGGAAAGAERPQRTERTERARRIIPAGRLTGGPARLALGLGALLAATVVLGLPYLSIREVSTGADIGTRNPEAALGDLELAGELNPLSPEPGRLGGAIALESGLYDVAQQRFRQAIEREPGGWYAWFGEGLADSALGEAASAARALRRAVRIERHQPVIQAALRRVDTTDPVAPRQALSQLLLTR